MKDSIEIEGFDYKVSSCGTVTNKVGHIMKQRISKWGYSYVQLRREGLPQKQKSVHRLVAQAFIPNPDNKPCVNHIDGNKTNNTLDNLEWCTHSENTKHAFKAGLISHKGEKNPRCKLTNKDLSEIRRYSDAHTLKEVAAFFKLSYSYTWAIVKGTKRKGEYCA